MNSLFVVVPSSIARGSRRCGPWTIVSPHFPALLPVVKSATFQAIAWLPKVLFVHKWLLISLLSQEAEERAAKDMADMQLGSLLAALPSSARALLAAMALQQQQLARIAQVRAGHMLLTTHPFQALCSTHL